MKLKNLLTIVEVVARMALLILGVLYISEHLASREGKPDVFHLRSNLANPDTAQLYYDRGNIYIVIQRHHELCDTCEVDEDDK